MPELEHLMEKTKAPDATPEEHDNTSFRDSTLFLTGVVVGGLVATAIFKSAEAEAYAAEAASDLLASLYKPAAAETAEMAARPIADEVTRLAANPGTLEREFTHIHFPLNASEGEKVDILMKAASHEPSNPAASGITHVDFSPGMSHAAKADQLMAAAARPPVELADKVFPQTLESIAAKHLGKP